MNIRDLSSFEVGQLATSLAGLIKKIVLQKLKKIQLLV